jgi:arthrofactin-type cyclic lipopeptide synthetase A
MVPAAFVAVAAWPLTGNGKLDKKALPKPQITSTARVEPENELEKRLASIVQRTLELPEMVCVEGNFFTLGGNSILAVRLVAECRKEDLPISVRDVFVAPTIRQLAMRLVTTAGQDADPSVPN